MKNFIEQRQIYIYLLSLVFAALLGLYIPNFTKSFEPAISILLTLLMFFMFSQIPFLSLRAD